MNNEAQCILLFCLSSRFMTYTWCLILGKLSLEKKATKPRFVIEILSNIDIAFKIAQLKLFVCMIHIIIFRSCCSISFFFFSHNSKIFPVNEEAIDVINETAIDANKALKIPTSCFSISCRTASVTSSTNASEFSMDLWF